MARRALSGMDLPGSAASMFASRALFSAKDVLCKSELELMELLDIPLPSLSSVVEKIQDCVCPRHCSVLSLWEERKAKEIGGGYLSTKLKELDDALNGGIPCGLITELVGASGVGKTQLCLMLAVLAAMPVKAGGLDRTTIYVDTERKFSSKRLVEIAHSQCADIAGNASAMQQLAEHVLVLHPSSLSDFMKSLQGLEVMIIERSACLIIVDSVAALLQSDPEVSLLQQQELLGQQASLLKFLAESFRIPVVVTNQVKLRGDIGGGGEQLLPSASFPRVPNSFIEQQQDEGPVGAMEDESLMAAFGSRWAHSINVRLLLEFSASGCRHIKIVKSPLSAPATVPYRVTTKGLELALTLAQEAQEAGDASAVPIFW